MRARVGRRANASWATAVVAALAAATEVIAATPLPDQRAATAAQAHGDGLALHGVWWAIWAALAAVAVGIALRARWLRVKGSELPPLRAAPLLAAGFFCMVLVAPLVGASVRRLLFGAGSEATEASLREPALTLVATFAAQAPIAAFLAIRFPAAVAFGTWGVGIAAGAVGALLAWPVITVAGGVAGALQQALTDTSAPPIAHATLQRMLDAPPDAWKVVMVAAVALGAPILEEIAYRGTLQPALRASGFGAWTSIGLASAAFVLMHVAAIPREGLAGALASLTVLSIALGVLRERTRGLVAPIVAHALFNAANLCLAGAR